ncbi:hypothetical protein Hte_004262 [Hypoxylon texense]
MVNLYIVRALLLVGLTAVAIYVQVTSSTLSLPLSTGTTVLTILLPLLAAVNTFGLLLRILPRQASTSPILQKFLPFVLQILQGVLAVVLATLAAEGFVPGQVLDCNLENSWQGLWHTKDGRAIERIQDAFSCCGLRSTVDRDWPTHQCKDLYKDRHGACLIPWRASMQRNSGLGFTVAVAVGILQLIQLAFFTLRTSEGGHARMGYRQNTSSFVSGPSDRLLGNGAANGDDDGTGPETNGSGGGRRGYGGTEDGPRVEPTHLGDSGEENTWG